MNNPNIKYSSIHSCPCCGKRAMDDNPRAFTKHTCWYCTSEYIFLSHDEFRFKNGVSYEYEMQILVDKYDRDRVFDKLPEPKTALFLLRRDYNRAIKLFEDSNINPLDRANFISNYFLNRYPRCVYSLYLEAMKQTLTDKMTVPIITPELQNGTMIKCKIGNATVKFIRPEKYDQLGDVIFMGVIYDEFPDDADVYCIIDNPKLMTKKISFLERYMRADSIEGIIIENFEENK